MKVSKLGQHITQVRGILFKPDDVVSQLQDGYAPIIKSNNIKEDGYDSSDLIYINRNLIRPDQFIKAGDLVLTASSGSKKTIGKNIQFEHDFNGSFGAFCKLIRPQKTINAKYLHHFFRTRFFRNSIEMAVQGANIANLKNEYIDELHIPLPLIDDQIRIAHLLGKVEGLVAQRKQHLQQLDDLLKSVFLEMFGDPVRNEKGLDIDRIGRSIKVQAGFAFKSKDITSSGTIKLVKIANVHFEDLTWDDVSYVPDSFIDMHKKFALQEGDLLIALTRPVIKSLNVVKTATVRKKDLPCLLNQRVARFLIDQTQINKRFFLQYCYTEFFKNTVEGLCPPGLQPNVSTNQIEEIPFFYPPIDLQNEFAAIAVKVDGIKARYQQSLTDLESLYGALSQQAFRGELDLSRVPKPGIQLEEEKTVAAEPLHVPAEQGLAIHLPDTDNLLDALESAEAREGLISRWLETYRGQLGSTPFSVQHFLAVAQTRLAELHPDNDFALGANDYEHIKAWVFDQIGARKLKQTRDIICVDGRRQFGNKLLLRARRLAQ